jgi:transcriptional regulator with XRE-family HTH domain
MRRVVPTPFPADPWADEPAVLGAAIRSARTQAGMTQGEAALALGISRDVLSDLERGKAAVALGTALRVAATLGVGVLITPSEQRERARTMIRNLAQ